MKLYANIACAILYLGSAAIAQGPVQPQAPVSSGSDTASSSQVAVVRTQMRNVDFHLTDRIVVHITALYGQLMPVRGDIPVFDDRTSFSLNVDSANISLSTTALSNDLNDFVFSKPDAPIKKLSVTAVGIQLVLKGLLASKGDIPFETDGTVAVTPDGQIRVHTVKVRALHLPVKGLMDMLGLDVAKMIDTKKVSGVTTDKDDLILDPQQLLPPPQMRGHLASIRIVNGEIQLVFGNSDAEAHSRTLSSTCGGRNFQSFKGGTVRFGKLTMNDADLELVDTDPTDPFDFSIEHYQEQLVAGYSKMTRQGGLCVHTPDFNKIKRSIPSKR